MTLSPCWSPGTFLHKQREMCWTMSAHCLHAPRCRPSIFVLVTRKEDGEGEQRERTPERARDDKRRWEQMQEMGGDGRRRARRREETGGDWRRREEMEMGRNTLGSPPWAPLSLRNEGSPTSSPGCHRRVPTRLKELHVSGRDRHFTATRSIIHHPAAPITARHTHACLSLRRAQIASFRSGPLSDFSSWWCGGVCSQDRMLRPLQGNQPTSTTSRGSPRAT
jgi:hypothetical protein